MRKSDERKQRKREAASTDQEDGGTELTRKRKHETYVTMEIMPLVRLVQACDYFIGWTPQYFDIATDIFIGKNCFL